jgi:hypothetical protein
VEQIERGERYISTANHPRITGPCEGVRPLTDVDPVPGLVVQLVLSLLMRFTLHREIMCPAAVSGSEGRQLCLVRESLGGIDLRLTDRPVAIEQST